jgi:hypothetical protein
LEGAGSTVETLWRRLEALEVGGETLLGRSFAGAGATVLASAAFSSAALLRLTIRKPAIGGGTATGRAFLGVTTGVLTSAGVALGVCTATGTGLRSGETTMKRLACRFQESPISTHIRPVVQLEQWIRLQRLPKQVSLKHVDEIPQKRQS